MKRPAWAGGKSFPLAFAAVERQALGSAALRAMAEARVITLEREQVEALPVEKSAGEILRHVRLPFPMVYVDLDHAQVPGLKAWLRGVHASEGGWVEGGGESVGLAVFVTTPLTPFGIGVVGGATLRDGEWGFAVSDDFKFRSRFGHPDPITESTALALQATMMGKAVAALSFLESYNVELVEAPLSRKQHKREVRKGKQIALTVHIKLPKTRSATRGNGTADYSHRFEVRGHYMHFPEGTRLADADSTKLSFVPGRGFVRKVWCPPHIKGPEDKPLIPKRRVVVA